jgi:hypothetical protein
VRVLSPEQPPNGIGATQRSQAAQEKHFFWQVIAAHHSEFLQRPMYTALDYRLRGGVNLARVEAVEDIRFVNHSNCKVVHIGKG